MQIDPLLINHMYFPWQHPDRIADLKVSNQNNAFYL